MALSISRLFTSASVAIIAPAVIVLAAPACSSDDVVGTPAGSDGGGTGGNASTGGAKNTGGSKNTGGANTGGSKATGGHAGATGGAGGATGGSPGTGGTDGGTGGTPGTGGAATGGSPGTGGAPIEAGTDAEAGCSPLSLTAPTVGTTIQAPSGATVVQHFHAVGTQNYTCKGTVLPADAGTTYSWGASVPEANLLEGSCQRGTHYAGPTWAFTADGSTVVGSKVDAEAHSGTIPWLLLKAVTNTGTGVFSNVTFIQRVDTSGGVSPSDPCDGAHVDEVKKVPYTAEYYFFEGGVGDAG